MKNNKNNEILKVVTVSAMSIGLFSAVFVAGNNIILESATNHQITMPSTQTVVNMLPHTEAIPENFPFPSFSVTDVTDPRTEVSASALSPEKAVELGARYIWEVFGEDIDGKAVDIGFTIPTATSRAHWVGWVWESDWERHDLGATRPRHSFKFIIDALTGERISIHDIRSDRGNSHLPERTMTMDQLFEREDTIPENIEMYTELAREFAQKHFNLTEVTEVVYDNMRFEVTERGNRYERNNAVVTYRETLLRFTATDERGRSALLTISMDTHRLHDLTTQRNDVVPGIQFHDHNTPWRSDGQRINEAQTPLNNILSNIVPTGELGGTLSAEEHRILWEALQDPSHPRHEWAKEMARFNWLVE